MRLSEDERAVTRSLIVDARHRVIAAADGRGIFEQYPIKTDGQKMGSYVDSSGDLVGFALTPGYETYAGLGWYGVIVQSQPGRSASMSSAA